MGRVLPYPDPDLKSTSWPHTPMGNSWVLPTLPRSGTNHWTQRSYGDCRKLFGYVLKNIGAYQQLSTITKISLGPSGLSVLSPCKKKNSFLWELMARAIFPPQEAPPLAWSILYLEFCC